MSALSAIRPNTATARQIAREFRTALNNGASIKCAGQGVGDPADLLRRGYGPRHRVDLFSNRFYLGDLREDEDIGYMVAYVSLRCCPQRLHARIFYKDLSLIWRCATHVVRYDDGRWIGKGAVRITQVDDVQVLTSAEHTTDLPLEIQTALDEVSRRTPKPKWDHRAVELILRNAPSDRLEPYRDFTAPREQAQSDPKNLINENRPIAWFRHRDDPGSLRFEKGFEPDFKHGVVECFESYSRFYGGGIRKFRILSTNQRIQYLFVEAPAHCWIIPPQTLSEDLSSYGVRTVDVVADEDLFVPGYEYHYLDEEQNPPQVHSQIPHGFAGTPNPFDDSRADASAWLDALPVIKDFRKVLGKP